MARLITNNSLGSGVSYSASEMKIGLGNKLLVDAGAVTSIVLGAWNRLMACASTDIQLGSGAAITMANATSINLGDSWNYLSDYQTIATDSHVITSINEVMLAGGIITPTRRKIDNPFPAINRQKAKIVLLAVVSSFVFTLGLSLVAIQFNPFTTNVVADNETEIRLNPNGEYVIIGEALGMLFLFFAQFIIATKYSVTAQAQFSHLKTNILTRMAKAKLLLNNQGISAKYNYVPNNTDNTASFEILPRSALGSIGEYCDEAPTFNLLVKQKPNRESNISYCGQIVGHHSYTHMQVGIDRNSRCLYELCCPDPNDSGTESTSIAIKLLEHKSLYASLIINGDELAINRTINSNPLYTIDLSDDDAAPSMSNYQSKEENDNTLNTDSPLDNDKSSIIIKYKKSPESSFYSEILLSNETAAIGVNSNSDSNATGIFMQQNQGLVCTEIVADDKVLAVFSEDHVSIGDKSYNIKFFPSGRVECGDLCIKPEDSFLSISPILSRSNFSRRSTTNSFINEDSVFILPTNEIKEKYHTFK